MKRKSMRVVYSVTTGGCDFYSAMTRVSIASLRVSNPSVKVTVACDAVSDTALQGSCDPLLNEIDEFVVCNTPDGDAGYRNRHMKTRLRELIEGPFLFLDSDTIIRGDLSPIFSLDVDIAGAPNHSRDEFSEQAWEASKREVMTSNAESLKSMGWQLGEKVYLNGGVLFCNETSNSYRFWSLWHQKWLDSVGKCAGHRDQPALNSALFEARPRLEILPHRFNAQVKVAPAVARDAVIWHFYASYSGVALTSFDVFVERVLRGERLCLDAVAETIQRAHPWRRESWLDDWLATGLAHNGHLSPGFNSWFQGNRASACYYWTVYPPKRALAALRWRLKLRTRLKDIIARIAPQHQ